MLPPSVFISYARADGLGHAGALSDALKRRGIEAFLDKERLRHDEPNPPPPIVAALEASRVIVLLVTLAYGQRPYCVYEAGLAVDRFLRGHATLLGTAMGADVRFPLLPHLPPCPTSDPVGWLAQQVEVRLASLMAVPMPPKRLRPWWTITPHSSALAGIEVASVGDLSERAEQVRSVAARWTELGWDPVFFRLRASSGDKVQAIRSELLAFPAGAKPLLSVGRDATVAETDVLALRRAGVCGVELVQPEFDALALEDRARVDVVRFPVDRVISPSDEWDAADRFRKRAWEGPTMLLDEVQDAEMLRRVRSFSARYPRLAVSGPAELIRAGAHSSPFHPLSGMAPCL